MTRTTAGLDLTTPSADLGRCLGCEARLEGRESCPGCGRVYRTSRGIWEATNALSGRNAITAAFYDGPAWGRFRRWERLFLTCQGGQRRARRPILGHLPESAEARVLEVGIGDGENLPLLPAHWEVHGVDIARRRLGECLARFPRQAGRLALAEAEALPFPDSTFDACLCVGGFTFFRDHATALREMRRVTRPGGPVVVADEVAWLCRLGIGHLLGRPRIDAWWLRGLGLEREFIDMVLDLRLDLDAMIASALPGARRYRIWHGLGYCVVHDGDTGDQT